MSKIEKFEFMGGKYEYEVFGDGKVRVYNGDLVKGKVKGVAFDFDGTITGALPKSENYVVRPNMISIINELQRKKVNTVILTSGSWKNVENMMRKDSYLKELTKIQTHCLDDTSYKNKINILYEDIGNPYLVKIPTVLGCNVIVDDEFAHTWSHDKFGKKLSYSFVDVSQMKIGDEYYLHEALISLKAL